MRPDEIKRGRAYQRRKGGEAMVVTNLFTIRSQDRRLLFSEVEYYEKGRKKAYHKTGVTLPNFARWSFKRVAV